jgi:murein DD-endopeptidase MepM/ murein hydrolase activator NlpD
MEDLALWEVLRLNPDPIPHGGRVLVPVVLDEPRTTSGAGGLLEAWVLDLSVVPQPVPRGQTAMIRLTTTSPVSCTVHYLDKMEACYTSGPASSGEAASSYAFLGLPALLPPGEHIATLTINAASSAIELPVSLRVSPGRFDFERIDLPPDRQSLLDPVRTQAERDTIAALRAVRSSERKWSLPFLTPLQGSITSYYGSRRSYGQGFSSYHAGADFQAATGAPVIAPASGQVVLADPLVIRGNAVMIDHGWGVMTGYWHLSTVDVSVGQEIEAGARIGAVGNTGLSTGSHLHWELWVNGIAVDPLPWLQATPDDFVELMRTPPGSTP